MKYKLFVGKLPKQFTEAELTKLFEKFGEVTDVFIMIDFNTNESKGCGFVSFSKKEDADNAINGLDGLFIFLYICFRSE
jgi:RNA recognition motif-containing protein